MVRRTTNFCLPVGRPTASVPLPEICVPPTPLCSSYKATLGAAFIGSPLPRHVANGVPLRLFIPVRATLPSTLTPRPIRLRHPGRAAASTAVLPTRPSASARPGTPAALKTRPPWRSDVNINDPRHELRDAGPRCGRLKATSRVGGHAGTCGQIPRA
jgi:hypothetical protein